MYWPGTVMGMRACALEAQSCRDQRHRSTVKGVERECTHQGLTYEGVRLVQGASG